MIDVGGPTMIRAAAKNCAYVTVVVSPADYREVLEELRRAGEVSEHTRKRLARAAFAYTASYDAAIVAWLDEDPAGADGGAEVLPETLHVVLERSKALRYGENPHQNAALYRTRANPAGWWEGAVQHGARTCRTSTWLTRRRPGSLCTSWSARKASASRTVFRPRRS